MVHMGVNRTTCIACGKPKGQFKDKISEDEWLISGFCQKCQDKTFG